jgi:hypothetical protein
MVFISVRVFVLGSVRIRSLNNKHDDVAKQASKNTHRVFRLSLRHFLVALRENHECAHRGLLEVHRFTERRSCAVTLPCRNAIHCGPCPTAIVHFRAEANERSCVH